MEWPKNWTLATANAGEDVEQQELVGMQDGTAVLENSFAVSYKTKHTHTIWSSNCAPLYLPKGVENVYPDKNMHMGVYCSIIHNGQNLEAAKMSFSWHE